MLQLSATWVNDTSLGFGKPRSKELKLLDTEIETYRRSQTWINLFAVAKALIAWEKASPMSERHRKPAVMALKTSLDIFCKIIKAGPSFSMTSNTWNAMLNALTVPTGTARTEALQTALDAITVSDAEMNKTVLKVVVDANPTVSYIGVKTFNATSSPSSQTWSFATDPTVSNRRIRYTSAKFSLQAQIYIVVPATSTQELGFIQHCTAKKDRAAYTDGSGMEDGCTAAFPVGDAPGGAADPWYCKGQSQHCTHPTWIQLTGPARTIDLEMNDWFDNNFHQYHPKSSAGYIATATLTSIDREQSFVCWLAHKKVNGSYRLIRKVTYTIKADVRVNAQGVVTSFTTSAQPIVVTTPLPTDTLPVVASMSMNNLSQWRYQNPTGTAWLPTTL